MLSPDDTLDQMEAKVQAMYAVDPPPPLGEDPWFINEISSVYTERGEITGFSRMPLAAVWMEQEQGERRILGTKPPSAWWVQDGQFAERPAIAAEISATTVAARQEVTITGLPACTLAYSGPMVGTHEHGGGDLDVGWVVPGTYTLTAKAWPSQDVVFIIEVTP